MFSPDLPSPRSKPQLRPLLLLVLLPNGGPRRAPAVRSGHVPPGYSRTILAAQRLLAARAFASRHSHTCLSWLILASLYLPVAPPPTPPALFDLSEGRSGYALRPLRRMSAAQNARRYPADSSAGCFPATHLCHRLSDPFRINWVSTKSVQAMCNVCQRIHVRNLVSNLKVVSYVHKFTAFTNDDIFHP